MRAVAFCQPLLLAVLAWALLAGMPAALATQGQPTVEYRFRAPPNTPAASFGPQVLTEAERAYLATLPEVRVAVSRPAFRPYEVIGDDGEISGVHPEMLSHLARAYGLKLRPVVFDAWPLAVAAARRREVDMLISVGVTSERAQFLEFTLGSTPMVSAMFVRRGHAPPPEHARFATPGSNIASDFVRRQYPQAALQEYPNNDAALQALARGEADYQVATLLPTLDRIGELRLAGIEVHRIVSMGTGYFHFAVRKDWAPLARILNKGISVLRQEPSRELSAALAGLPASAIPPPARPLAPGQLAAIIERPVWRLGAVRGLTLLNGVGPDDRHTGIAAEYAETVARHLGVGLHMVPFDSVAAMLDALRAGTIDMVPFLTRTDERARQFGFSKPYVEMPYMIVARSDAPLYWNLGSLQGRRIALAAQHPVRELLARRYPQIRVVDVQSGAAAMDAVARGDAEAAIEVKFFANSRIQGDNDGVLRTVAVVDELPAQFHFATARDAHALLPLIDEALVAIPDAESERLLRRWVAQDLTPPFPWRRHAPLIAVSSAALLLVAALTAWWMRRLQREVSRRRRSEELLTDVATTVPGVVFRYVVDGAGALRHVFISPSTRAFLGIDPAAGRTLLQSMAPFMSADEREAALAQERDCAASGERFKFTGVFRPPAGAPRWLHSEAVHTRDAQGLSVWTGYVVDVSTERELQQRLAREADSRNLLLAAASHELRAPTHNLSLALQALAGTPLAPEAAQAHRIAQRSAQTLTQLLNDVLDAARFDTGPLRLRPTPFSPRELLDELAEAWSASARAKGLGFELRVAGVLPPLLNHDPLRLKQILTNLISNACKYTVAGEVIVRARPEGGELVVEVSDTGPGLDAAEQARLFQPFVTLHDEAPREPQGRSGLGLSICRRIAALMGGRVELASTPGRGSTFTLHLPIVVPGVAAVASDQSGAPGGAVGRAQTAEPDECGYPGDAPAAAMVVVCDDDPVSRTLAAQMLRLRGYKVIEAGDGATALALWRDGDVAALVTDMDMPGLQGHELIRELRSAEAGRPRRTVIVVCSGSPLPAGGAAPLLQDAYLLKPVQIDALVQTLLANGVVPAAREVTVSH